MAQVVTTETGDMAASAKARQDSSTTFDAGDNTVSTDEVLLSNALVQAQTTRDPITTTSPSCPFLKKLPAELRNDIYELTFDVSSQQRANYAGKVNLVKANPPSQSLLLTCRQVRAEAKGIYDTAKRKYWTDTDFIIDRDLGEYIPEDFRSLSRSDIAHITSLTIVHRGRPWREVRETSTLLDNRGLWKVTVPGSEGSPEFCIAFADDTSITHRPFSRSLPSVKPFMWLWQEAGRGDEQEARRVLDLVKPSVELFDVVVQVAWDASRSVERRLESLDR